MSLQHLLLADDLFPAVWSGAKSGTIRAGHRDVAPGTLVLEATDGTRHDTLVDVAETTATTLSGVPQSAIAMEGLSSRAELLATLRRFYPEIGEDSPVTVIRWTNVRFRDGTGPAPSQLAA